MKTLQQSIKEALSMIGIGPFTIYDASENDSVRAKIESTLQKLCGAHVDIEGSDGWWEIFGNYDDIYQPGYVNTICDLAVKYGDGKIYNIGTNGIPKPELAAWFKAHGYDTSEIDNIDAAENMYQTFIGISTEDFRELVADFIK